jgi:hypothetical protein
MRHLVQASVVDSTTSADSMKEAKGIGKMFEESIDSIIFADIGVSAAIVVGGKETG